MYQFFAFQFALKMLFFVLRSVRNIIALILILSLGGFVYLFVTNDFVFMDAFHGINDFYVGVFTWVKDKIMIPINFILDLFGWTI